MYNIATRETHLEFYMTKSRLKVNFITDDLQKEAEYLCFLARNICKGIYSKDSFYVLPYLEKLNIKAVYFPDLGYSRDFWRKINISKNNDFGGNYPEECVGEVLSKLTKSKSNNFDKLIREWKQKEPDFFNIIDILFDNQTSKIKGINIILTEYGTLGSFNVKDGNFIATHRVDIHSDDIGRKILYMLIKMVTKKSTEIGENDWYQRRAIANYILEHSKLNRIIPNAKNTAPKKKESILKKDSANYLKKLGFYPENQVFKISQWGKVTIRNKDISKIFTTSEEQVVKVLLKNKGEIVNFIEFSSIPSLYALAKVIENIRTKIRDLGINKEVITTVRGRGYLLN